MEPQYTGKAYDIYAELAENGGFYMKMFVPQNLNYLLKELDKKRSAEEEALSEHEKNNDAAYADQSRKKIAQLDELMEKYSSLIQLLQE